MTSQLAQTTNRRLLDMVIGETYVRQVRIFYADRANNLGYTFGEAGWGAEFSLYGMSPAREFVFSCSVANGRAAWAEPGLLVWSIPRDSTVDWSSYQQFTFHLSVTAPTTIVDPSGTTKMIDQGVINVIKP